MIAGESLWVPLSITIVGSLIHDIKSLFPVVRYAYTQMPTYTTGQIGFVLASKNKVRRETPNRFLL